MSAIEVELLGHACAEIRVGGATIITDPWLVGTAFLGGWQRKYDPPADWLDRLRKADLIYISHSHSDHMNPDTLRTLKAVRPDAPIVVPRFPSRSAGKAIRKYGFQRTCDKILEVPLNYWCGIGDEGRYMIVGDSSGKDDSGLIVEYRGHYLINTVDCNMPNGLDLPTENVDWLLAPFAGGATPYPICYSGMYVNSLMDELLLKNKWAALQRLSKLLNLTKPSHYMPFAGFFVETDERIRSRNNKNTVLDAQTRVLTYHEGYDVVMPTLKEAEFVKPPVFPYREVDVKGFLEKSGYDFSAHGLQIFEYEDGVCIESHRIGDPKKQSTSIHVPSRLFRHVIAERLPWDEMLIGFHAQLLRHPDVYEAEFWSHFQNNIPEA